MLKPIAEDASQAVSSTSTCNSIALAGYASSPLPGSSAGMQCGDRRMMVPRSELGIGGGPGPGLSALTPAPALAADLVPSQRVPQHHESASGSDWHAELGAVEAEGEVASVKEAEPALLGLMAGLGQPADDRPFVKKRSIVSLTSLASVGSTVAGSGDSSIPSKASLLRSGSGSSDKLGSGSDNSEKRNLSSRPEKEKKDVEQKWPAGGGDLGLPDSRFGRPSSSSSLGCSGGGSDDSCSRSRLGRQRSGSSLGSCAGALNPSDESSSRGRSASSHDSFSVADDMFGVADEEDVFDLDRYRLVFSRFDADGGGRLDVHELTSALAALGHTLSSLEVQELAMKHGRSGDGNLNVMEFTSLAGYLYIVSARRAASRLAGINVRPLYGQTKTPNPQLPSLSLVELREAFARFDSDKGGELELPELAAYATEILGYPLSKAELRGLAASCIDSPQSEHIALDFGAFAAFSSRLRARASVADTHQQCSGIWPQRQLDLISSYGLR